jgi:protein involved in polysaccharide export with SLBB domain
LKNRQLGISGKWNLLLLLFLIVLAEIPAPARAQFSTYEAYQRQVQNQIGVADTLTEKLMAQRQAIRMGQDAQSLEAPIDPKLYKLGPGDGVYLNVYAAHSLDQDLIVTPEGKILVPRTGEISVAGMSLADAEKKINELLMKDYRNPQASLSLRKLRSFKVNVLGDVLSPGLQSVTAMDRLNEVIDKAGGLKGTSSLRNIEIRSHTGALRVHGDLVKYYSGFDLSANPTVEAGDVIVVQRVEHTVTISGAVVAPSTMEFVQGDSLSTLIRLVRGLSASAQPDSVEISRFDPAQPSMAKRFYVNYGANQDLPLADGDVVYIRSIPQFHVAHVVSVAGEVKYPGRYSIELGQTKLSDVLSRAGGMQPEASLEEAALIRRVGVGSWEQDPEWIRLEKLGLTNADRMSADEYNYYVARMRQLGRTTMVVDFRALVERHDLTQDLLLREEDSLWIPRARGYVNVSGSVNNQGNVLYIANGSYLDYIRKAGGFASSADKSGVRIINSRTSSYIDPASQRDYQIGPGDTIVVPAEHSDFWKNFATTTAITAQVITIIAGILLIFQKRN